MRAQERRRRWAGEGSPRTRGVEMKRCWIVAVRAQPGSERKGWGETRIRAARIRVRRRIIVRAPHSRAYAFPTNDAQAGRWKHRSTGSSLEYTGSERVSADLITPQDSSLQPRIGSYFHPFTSPGWRNWQTQRTQNPSPSKGVWVRDPLRAPVSERRREVLRSLLDETVGAIRRSGKTTFSIRR